MKRGNQFKNILALRAKAGVGWALAHPAVLSLGIFAFPILKYFTHAPCRPPCNQDEDLPDFFGKRSAYCSYGTGTL